MNKLIVQKNEIYQTMEEPIDQSLTKDEDLAFTLTRKERTKVVLSSVGHHEPIYIPFCGNDGAYQNSNFQSCENPECKDCTVSFDNLDNTQTLLLHWYSKVEYGF